MVLIGAAIDGLVNKDMPTVFVILIMAVGVMNLRRLLPPTEEPVAE